MTRCMNRLDVSELRGITCIVIVCLCQQPRANAGLARFVASRPGTRYPVSHTLQAQRRRLTRWNVNSRCQCHVGVFEPQNLRKSSPSSIWYRAIWLLTFRKPAGDRSELLAVTLTYAHFASCQCMVGIKLAGPRPKDGQ